MMNFHEVKSLNKTQKHQLMVLWNKEYPKKLSYSSVNDLEQYFENLLDKHHIVIIDDRGTLKGWLVHFTRKEERWFAMIIDSSIQGGGFGSRLLNLAKESNLALNGWVIDNDNELKQNGELYKSPIGFYRKNGFGILTDLKFDYQNIQGIKVKWQNPVFNK